MNQQTILIEDSMNQQTVLNLDTMAVPKRPKVAEKRDAPATCLAFWKISARRLGGGEERSALVRSVRSVDEQFCYCYNRGIPASAKRLTEKLQPNDKAIQTSAR